jgi:hypothetical protein
MEDNNRFVSGRLKPEDWVNIRKSLTKEQHPKVMVLGCPDSRVPPDVIFDQALGSLFEVRTAGNIASPLGLASLEYAFDHLGSTVLVALRNLFIKVGALRSPITAIARFVRFRSISKLLKGFAMSFALYLIGSVVAICGVIYAGHLLHIPTHWIVAGAAVLLGLGILAGVKATRQKDPSD